MFSLCQRLWHTACQGKDADVIVFGGSCDYILLVDTVSIFIYIISETKTHYISWNAELFPCMLQSNRHMWRTFMRARLIVSFSGSLQWCTCFPDSALSSIQVIKKKLKCSIRLSKQASGALTDCSLLLHLKYLLQPVLSQMNSCCFFLPQDLWGLYRQECEELRRPRQAASTSAF